MLSNTSGRKASKVIGNQIVRFSLTCEAAVIYINTGWFRKAPESPGYKTGFKEFLF